jgi:hypothetical protein
VPARGTFPACNSWLQGAASGGKLVRAPYAHDGYGASGRRKGDLRTELCFRRAVWRMEAAEGSWINLALGAGSRQVSSRLNPNSLNAFLSLLDISWTLRCLSSTRPESVIEAHDPPKRMRGDPAPGKNPPGTLTARVPGDCKPVSAC